MPFISYIHNRFSTIFLYSPKPSPVRAVSTMNMGVSVRVNVDHRQDAKNMTLSKTHTPSWQPAQDHRVFEHSVAIDSGTEAPQPSYNASQSHQQEKKQSPLRSRCRTLSLSKDDSEPETEAETRPLLHPPAPVVIDGIAENCPLHDPSTLTSSETDMNAERDFYALYNPPDSKLWSIAR